MRKSAKFRRLLVDGKKELEQRLVTRDKMRCARDAPTKLKDDFFRAVLFPRTFFRKSLTKEPIKVRKRKNKKRKTYSKTRRTSITPTSTYLLASTVK